MGKPNGTQRSTKHGRKTNSNKSTKHDRKTNSDKSTAFKRPRHEKLEIKFDPEARKEYLTSLSSKKKERRTFGLAMQKVKDRRAKLEEKKETRKAVLEQIEEAERIKNQERQIRDESCELLAKLATYEDIEEKEEKITTFKDETTQSQFGGQVVVTTTYNILSDDEKDSDKEGRPTNKKFDKEQAFAGSVQKYLGQLKGNLPSKRRKSQDNHRIGGKKGKHGAENMKGMGTSKDLKLAKKALDRSRDKGGGGKGKNNKRRK